MKKRIFALLLLLALTVSSLASCSLMDAVNGLEGTAQPSQPTDATYMTREEVEALLRQYAAAPGDSYQITVTPSGDSTALAVAGSRALLSAVSITCNFTVTTGYGYGYGYGTSQTQSMGAGVIFRLDKEQGGAYVLTNYHVVYNSAANTKNKVSDDISLYLYGQETQAYAIPATYVGGSMTYDLAVLKVEGSDVLRASNAVAATFADSDQVAVLDTVFAVGNPEGKGISATVGHLNVDSENISLTGADDKTTVTLRVMRIDAAVNSGNSGGALFNSRGEVIGIVNAKMASSQADNIGYAIPSNVAKNIAENILYYCDGTDKQSVYRCLIGITVTASASSTVYDTDTGLLSRRETVSVASVTAGGIADGRIQEGDVILSIQLDGTSHPVNRTYQVVDTMLKARVGSQVTFRVLRDGAEQDVTLTITEDSLTRY